MQRFALVLDHPTTTEAIGYVRARNATNAWQRFFRIARLDELQFLLDLGADVRVERANAHAVITEGEMAGWCQVHQVWETFDPRNLAEGGIGL